MDAEFWASRVTAAKRQSSLQSAQSHTDQYLTLDDLEGDDEAHISLPCPFCYVDFDAAILCFHLEEEHCFEAKNVVCPFCAANVGKDMVGHIRFQHSQLCKLHQRRRFWKGGNPSNSALSVRGKELRDGRLHSLVGGASARPGGCSSNAAPDPLLASFISSLPISETEEQEKPTSFEESATEKSSNLKVLVSTDSSATDGEREQMFEEEVQRAEFVQRLVLSTILHDGF